MISREKNIELTVFYDGETHFVKTYPNEYRNLMMLIYDKLCTEEFGECLGMGKCGTCLVEILGTGEQLSSFGRNEDTTLIRAGLENEHVRLSCQILVDHHLNGLSIKVR